MKVLHLAVVCPVSGLPQHTEQARQAVWTEVTKLLQPDLGKLYDCFYPASNAWGVDWNVPFGVLLGREDPIRFMRAAVKATEQQNAAIDFHMAELLARVDTEQAHEVGGALIVHLDGTDGALMYHSAWHIGLAAGALLPDCGIYYTEHRRAVIGPEQKTAIAGNLAGYAMCVVRLEASV